MSAQTLWHEAAPGVWHTVVGTPEDLTLLGVVGATANLTAMCELPEVALPAVVQGLTAETGPQRTVLTLPLEADEGLYGLGLQFLKVNHRGRTRFLRTNSDPKEDTGESHAPVPFYVSSRGYGLLVDSARIVTIYCGSCLRRDSASAALRDRATDPAWEATPASDRVEIVLGAGGVDLYLFTGPQMLDVVRRYNLYAGGGALPPRWGLGFWHRVNISYTDAQVLAEGRAYRQRGYPCDVIGLEPGWHSWSYPTSYEWSPARFPKPARFVQDMAQEGFHVNLWENPWVSPKSALHPPLAPYAGSHTVWGGLAADYTLPEARQLLQAQHDREHLAIGVSGYKLDECDGSELTGCSWMFPAHAAFPSGHDGEQMRQVYGLLLQKMTADLFHRRDRRTYGLVRASSAGASALPYVLYSDLYDHRQFVRALCNSGFSGLLWTPEVRDARTAEEWVRRMQGVVFSPLAMLNAWWTSTMPWSFPEVEGIIHKYLDLRMRLLPYFYSAFARYHFEGLPPFRAMALETGLNLDIGDQYMAGDCLLVAPMFAGQNSREVWLPEGAWYDFESSKRFEGGQTVRVFPGLDKLPVFVKDGGIVPLMPALPHAPRAGEQVPLEVRHYGQASGAFRLYDDDGETYAYERGEYRWIDLQVAPSPDGSRRGQVQWPEGWPSSYSSVTWKFMG